MSGAPENLTPGDPAVEAILAHVARVEAEGVPPATVAAAKIFLADTIAVAVAGARAPWRRELLDVLAAAGGRPEAGAIGTGEHLPLAQAAMLNAYQIHCQEFDCVHEAGVVHPMAAIAPCLLGWAEREGGVSGERFLRALAVAVDVAVTLGLCSRAPMRFFRPANAGGFGATVGLGMLAGLGAERLRDAIGIYYGQCAGTMQAHEEGTPQLAMQMGFAARAAVTAVELARRGVPGPHRALSGRFGYFALFDGAADPAPFDRLGRDWRVCELSHKPWPSGRATHGGIDALLSLREAHAVAAEAVAACRFHVPPLTSRLIGRPAQPGMSPAYARLCLQYVGAVCLRRGAVGLEDFTDAALADPETLTLARRLEVLADTNPDPNALGPLRVELDLVDGRSLAATAAAVLGSPQRPLSPQAARAKFDACGAAAASWDAVAGLDRAADVGDIARVIL